MRKAISPCSTQERSSSHIAQRHAGLLPDDANARARAITWMFAAVNTVEPPTLELGVQFMGPEPSLNSLLIAAAVRTAQQLTGKKQVTGEDVRRGLETLRITPIRKEMGLEGFAAPINVSCSDHNGHHGIYLAQWDGTKWTKASDWIEPIRDRVMPLIENAAKEYANLGWPKHTEPCDKSSNLLRRSFAVAEPHTPTPMSRSGGIGTTSGHADQASEAPGRRPNSKPRFKTRHLISPAPVRPLRSPPLSNESCVGRA
jgi:hypothetical protein